MQFMSANNKIEGLMPCITMCSVHGALHESGAMQAQETFLCLHFMAVAEKATQQHNKIIRMADGRLR